MAFSCPAQHTLHLSQPLYTEYAPNRVHIRYSTMYAAVLSYSLGYTSLHWDTFENIHSIFTASIRTPIIHAYNQSQHFLKYASVLYTDMIILITFFALCI